MTNRKSSARILILLPAFWLGAADKPDAGGQLRQLRFSWDGSYVLSQDASEITVLTTNPLAVSFRIPAENSTLAQFTPDSKQLAFVNSATLADPARITISHGTPDVVRWSVPDRAEITPIQLPGWTCGSMALAPDLRTFACDDFEGTLRAIDLASSEKILEIKRFVQPIFTWINLQRYDFPTDLGGAHLEFSPDGRLLIAIGAGGSSGGSTVIWDLPERRAVKAKGLLRSLKPGSAAYAFLTSDRVLLPSTWWWGRNYMVPVTIVTVPDGRAVATAKIPVSSEMHRAADAKFLIVAHPFAAQYVPWKYGMRKIPRHTEGSIAVELATGQAIISDSAMLDVFGNHYITEVRPGEIGLYERGKGLQASIVLHKK